MTEENAENAGADVEKQQDQKDTVAIKAPPGKVLSFVKQLFPSLSSTKTFRERFKRISKKIGYAQNLKITNPSIMSVCKYDGDSTLVATVFQSHTKINTGFMPYAGKKSKK